MTVRAPTFEIEAAHQSGQGKAKQNGAFTRQRVAQRVQASKLSGEGEIEVMPA